MESNLLPTLYTMYRSTIQLTRPYGLWRSILSAAQTKINFQKI